MFCDSWAMVCECTKGFSNLISLNDQGASEITLVNPHAIVGLPLALPVFHKQSLAPPPPFSSTQCVSADKWSPALQIRTVLLSIQALLSAPNPDDPLANDVAEQWKTNEVKAIETGECRVSDRLLPPAPYR